MLYPQLSTSQHSVIYCVIKTVKETALLGNASDWMEIKRLGYKASIPPLLLHLQEIQKKFVLIKTNTNIREYLNHFKINLNMVSDLNTYSKQTELYLTALTDISET